MKGLLDNLAGLGVRRLLLLGGGAVALLAALWFGLGMALAPTYRPLVADTTAANAAQMVTELEKAGFAPQVSIDGTMISLPEEDIARARMALAEAGLPPAGNAGWELFDNPSIIGMNSGLQQVNRLRALEGELARSIETIDIVEMARVHLVLPERETFSEDRPQASASIVVRTRPGQVLERSQALAVRSLVAAAVPGLSPERVTVLSSTGEAILSESDDADGVSQEQSQIEDRLRRNIESILGAYVGAENVRVRVAAELDPAHQVVVEQSFNPDQQVPRSVTTSTDKSQSQDSSASGVDVSNNLPALTSGAGGNGGSTANSDSQSQETQYEIGNTRSETVTEAGAIKRLSVAVLVNGTWDGTTYTERTPDDLAKLASLVKSAAGIVDDRGDTVTVESLRFVEGDPGLDGGSGGLAAFLAQHFATLVRSLIGLAIVAMALLLGVRPALRLLAAPPAAPEAATGGLPLLGGEGEAPMMMALAGPMAAPAMGAGMALPALQEEGANEVVSFSSFAGGVTRHYVDDFSRLIETEPEASLRTIRAWINQKG